MARKTAVETHADALRREGWVVLTEREARRILALAMRALDTSVVADVGLSLVTDDVSIEGVIRSVTGEES